MEAARRKATSMTVIREISTENKLPELSSLLFSMNTAIEKLNSILVDTLILNMNFEIVALGSDVETLLGFTNEDLADEAFESICEDANLVKELKSGLQGGYFQNKGGYLINSEGERVGVVFSGFYLGLISDINGYIVLRVCTGESNKVLKKELVVKQEELDSFIYRTAHDLRGPLATIKGLINLLKIRKDNVEVDTLISLIDVHAHKLDDRLFKLLYMADLQDVKESAKGWLNFLELESNLKKSLNDNCQIHNAKLLFNSPVTMLNGINEAKVMQLFSSILLFVISLPVSSASIEDEVRIVFDVIEISKNFGVKITCTGFTANDEVQWLVNHTQSLYNDLLSNPYLFNYYVAQKRALQMGATMKMEFYGSNMQVINLMVPIKNDDRLKLVARHQAKPGDNNKSI